LLSKLNSTTAKFKLLSILPLEVLSGILDPLILKEAAYAFRIRPQHVHMLIGGSAILSVRSADKL
jgi:hypothetical protein